jgi:hypothetical protein
MPLIAPRILKSVAGFWMLCGVATTQGTAPTAQTPTASPSSSAPFPASLDVHFASDTVTYRVGEEIPLDLEFRGTADKDYYFSTGTCGVLGRMTSSERVIVTPTDGTDDPLADYYGSAGGFAGSCPEGWHALDGTALHIRVLLNDAVRFRRPGMYQIVITSTRLARYSSHPAPVLSSAPVSLRIIPIDDVWATGEVAHATDLVTRGNPIEVRHGAAILRYLGTEGAAHALVEHYEAIAAAGADIQAALISSPDRALIVRQMEARLDAGAALDPSFVATLTRLHVLRELPLTPGDAVARRERSAIVQAEYDSRWRAALSRRPATAETLGAELARLPNAGADLREQIANDLDQHPAEAADAFARLPPDLQSVLLQPATNRPPTLNGPWVLPALRRVYAEWHGNRNGVPAGDLALTRLYELAPEEGRRLILEEIRTSERGIGYDALAILPDASLPELDAVLESRYASPLPTNAAALYRARTTAWLIARYGSPNLLPFVATLLTRGLACDIEGGLTAYLLKHDPEAAMRRLDPRFDRAAGEGCVAPLPALAAHYWDDRVQAAAIADLGAPVVMRVIEAAQILGTRGSAGAKQPLLDRLAQWSDEWRDRAAELSSRPDPNSPEFVENNIVNALFRNARFALTKDEAAHIRALCVTDRCRMNADAVIRARGLN